MVDMFKQGAQFSNLRNGDLGALFSNAGTNNGKVVGSSSAPTPITDSSSGAMNFSDPFGNTWRGIGSSWFNAGNVAREDYYRQQQMSAYQQSLQKELNEQSAALSEKLQRNLRQTAYQDTMRDLQKAGLNPILAFTQGATQSYGSVGSGSVGSGSVDSSSRNLGESSLLLGIAQLAAGLYTQNHKLTLSGAKTVVGSLGGFTTTTTTYQYK